MAREPLVIRARVRAWLLGIPLLTLEARIRAGDEGPPLLAGRPVPAAEPVPAASVRAPVSAGPVSSEQLSSEQLSSEQLSSGSAREAVPGAAVARARQLVEQGARELEPASGR